MPLCTRTPDVPPINARGAEQKSASRAAFLVAFASYAGAVVELTTAGRVAQRDAGEVGPIEQPVVDAKRALADAFLSWLARRSPVAA